MKEIKVYSKVDQLPSGRADLSVQPGCIVLEGGGWRGLYTGGALDALMEEGINFQTTIGVSAGALFGIGYVSGQIGWASRFDLLYRNDRKYCGIGAMHREHGITGFHYLVHTLMKEAPIDKRRFYDSSRDYYAVGANMLNGQAEYFKKGRDNIVRGIYASATVPYVSRPVVIDGVPYLDGGCAVRIPYEFAKSLNPEKIMVIRTRDRSFRKEEKGAPVPAKVLYRGYPEFLKSLDRSNRRYNELLDQLDTDEAAGRSFVLAPKEPVTVSKFDNDMEKLGELYFKGYYEMKERMGELKAFLRD